MPVLLYGIEAFIWRENERFGIIIVQMYNLRGLLVIRGMDRVPNTQIRELVEVAKGFDDRIDESVLRWSAILKEWKMIGLLKECVGRRPRKRWIDSVNDYL